MIPIAFVVAVVAVWVFAVRPHLARRERALFVVTAEQEWAAPIPLALRRAEGERRLKRWEASPTVYGPRHVPELAGLAWNHDRTAFVGPLRQVAGSPFRVAGDRVVTYERCLAERWWR